MSDTQHLIPVIPFADAVMIEGRGSYLYDRDGNAYLDLTSGQFCAVLGHCNPEVEAAIAEKTHRLVHTSTSVVSEEVVECSHRLNRISGAMNASSILLSTGAEVVEFCLRYAKNIKDKPGILCFDKGYHGLTLGAQSITFTGRFARPSVADVYAVPVPETGAAGAAVAESLDTLEQVMKRQNDVAALLVEPIVSVGGMIFPPPAWFQGVRQLCDQYDILLVLDECQTGFGRTGDWFAYQTYDFVPDMVATAKGIGLGYPVAAALFRDSLAQRGPYHMTHYSSHQNDPFGAAVVNAGIEYFEQHNVLAQVRQKGEFALAALRDATAASPHLERPRGLGLMLGADLTYPGVSDYRPVYHRLSEVMLQRGVLLQGTDGGHTLRLLPDYLIDQDDFERALGILVDVLSDLDWR